MIFYALLVLLVVALITWRILARRRERAELLGSTLSDRDRTRVTQLVPLVTKLPPDLRHALEGKINLFLHQVEFLGCNGLKVTDDMRLSIAAQACLLVVNKPAWYDHLTTVLVYPGVFKSVERIHDGYVVSERETIRSGESWSRGPVILSWPHAHQGAVNFRDGHNVVLHEFAHQLDDLSGHTDGAPPMETGQSFADWERVFLGAYDTHVQNVEQGRKTVLDAYGAEAPEEFFAVAVEAFFEKPQALGEDWPEVYAQLQLFFQLDPASWN